MASQTAARSRNPLARSGRAAQRVAAPAVDLQRFLDAFKLPGVDVKSIVDGRRADIQAVALANKRACDGMKALAKREAEMLRDAVAEWRVIVKDLDAMDGGDFAARRTELARQAIAKALANVRELAELVARSQAEACGAVRACVRADAAGSKQTQQPIGDDA